MKNKIIFILAEGFEEVEALAPIDFLRRLGFEIAIVGVEDRKIKGAHGIVVEADMILPDLPEIPNAVILPGGMPGSTNLRDSEAVLELIRNTYEKGNLIAAICAAPIVLNAAGILGGKTITSHPSVENIFGDTVNCTGRRVEHDGNIITAKAAGVSFEFAAKIAEYYHKKEEAETLLKAMYVKC
jgi:protein deglycase